MTIKPQNRKWGWNVNDVMPRRDELENLRILKGQLVEPKNSTATFNGRPVEGSG